MNTKTADASDFAQGNMSPNLQITQSLRRGIVPEFSSGVITSPRDAVTPLRGARSSSLNYGASSVRQIQFPAVSQSHPVSFPSQYRQRATIDGSLFSSMVHACDHTIPIPHHSFQQANEINAPPVENPDILPVIVSPPSLAVDVTDVTLSAAEILQGLGDGTLTLFASEDNISPSKTPQAISIQSTPQNAHNATPRLVEEKIAESGGSQNPPSNLRILSIDGGGVSGIMPTTFLAVLEEKLGGPLSDYFDLIIGKSASAIAVASAAIGHNHSQASNSNRNPQNHSSMADLSRILLAHQDAAVDSACFSFCGLGTSRNPAESYEAMLLKLYGDTTLLADPHTNVALVAYDDNRNKATTFNTFDRSKNFYMRDVVRAASAAPSRFPSAVIYSIPDANSNSGYFESLKKKKEDEYTFLDGGIVGINPSLDALILVREHYDPVDRYIFVSLGSGEKFSLFDGDMAVTHKGGDLSRCDVISDGQSQTIEKYIKADLHNIDLPGGKIFQQYYRFHLKADAAKGEAGGDRAGLLVHEYCEESIIADQMDQLVRQLKEQRTEPTLRDRSGTLVNGMRSI
ncbi:MAG: patatin-like phospholipase family protein [Alphaproteobacteria bacterium]|nr:patatin-like phospholipase family protein [Alphaproteobacteria bacterium]